MQNSPVNFEMVATVIGNVAFSGMAKLAIASADFKTLAAACGYLQVVPGQNGNYMALYEHDRVLTFGPLAKMPENAVRKYTYIQTNTFDKEYLLKELYDAIVDGIAESHGLERPSGK